MDSELTFFSHHPLFVKCFFLLNSMFYPIMEERRGLKLVLDWGEGAGFIAGLLAWEKGAGFVTRWGLIGKGAGFVASEGYLFV